MKTLDILFKTLPQKGTVTWIGVRPERRAEMLVVDAVEAKTQSGLTGDRYAGQIGQSTSHPYSTRTFTRNRLNPRFRIRRPGTITP